MNPGPILPDPATVAADNPHGTDWRPVATGLVTGFEHNVAGFDVHVRFQSAEGYLCDYGYRTHAAHFTYFPQYGNCPARTYEPGWSLWAN